MPIASNATCPRCHTSISIRFLPTITSGFPQPGPRPGGERNSSWIVICGSASSVYLTPLDRVTANWSLRSCVIQGSTVEVPSLSCLQSATPGPRPDRDQGWMRCVPDRRLAPRLRSCRCGYRRGCDRRSLDSDWDDRPILNAASTRPRPRADGRVTMALLPVAAGEPSSATQREMRRLLIGSLQERSLMGRSGKQNSSAPRTVSEGRVIVGPRAPSSRANAAARSGWPVVSPCDAPAACSTWVRVAVALVTLALVAGDPSGILVARGRAQQGDRLPEGTVTELRIEGNATIPTEKVRAKLLSRAGQPLDQQKVEADIKSLIGTKWFSDVQSRYQETAPKSGKPPSAARVAFRWSKD
jgi:hypothetical protein